MRRTAAVVLAAGASSRLGQPKQLVLLQGEPLLERAVRVAVEAGCSPVLVILGCRAEAIRGACDLHTAEVVCNPAWEEGIASSIRCGVEALQGRAEALLMMTCDQPAVTPEHLRALCKLQPDAVIASAYAHRRGVPAYFPAESFRDLMELSGDSGARDLLRAAITIDLPDGEFDIDTPDALLQLSSDRLVKP